MYGGPWLSRHIQISHGTTKYLTAQPKTLTAQPNISRRKQIDHGGSKFHGGTLACCMSIKAKMAEIRKLGRRDLELPEEEEDVEGLIRCNFFSGFEYKEIRLFLF